MSIAKYALTMKKLHNAVQTNIYLNITYFISELNQGKPLDISKIKTYSTYFKCGGKYSPARRVVLTYHSKHY